MPELQISLELFTANKASGKKTNFFSSFYFNLKNIDWRSLLAVLTKHPFPIPLRLLKMCAFEFSHRTPGWLVTVCWSPHTRHWSPSVPGRKGASVSGMAVCVAFISPLKVHTLLSAEPNLWLIVMSESWESYSIRGNAFPYPPGTLEPEQVTLRLTLAGTQVSWAMGYFGSSSCSLPWSSEGPSHCWCFRLPQIRTFLSLRCLHAATMRLAYRPRCCKNLQ